MNQSNTITLLLVSPELQAGKKIVIRICHRKKRLENVPQYIVISF